MECIFGREKLGGESGRRDEERERRTWSTGRRVPPDGEGKEERCVLFNCAFNTHTYCAYRNMRGLGAFCIKNCELTVVICLSDRWWADTALREVAWKLKRIFDVLTLTLRA